MSFQLDSTWQRSPITLSSGVTEAFSRTELDPRAADALIHQHAASVVRDGGMLFQRFGEPPPQETVISVGGIVSYRGEPAKPELWYLPKRRFAESLVGICFFGARMYSALRGVMVNGYGDTLLYERGLIATNLPLVELKQRAHINVRARAADKAPDFSRLIRQDPKGGN